MSPGDLEQVRTNVSFTLRRSTARREGEMTDIMQSLLPALYPILKTSLGLGFGEIGLITLTYQLTASLLQPVVGLAADRKPQPYSLAVAMGFAFVGLLMLSRSNSLFMLLAAAAMIGMSSSIFHP